MNQTTNVQKLRTEKEVREQLKLQLAEYLAQQPESTQSANRWMKRADAAGMGIVIAAFAVASSGSFAWANASPTMIPIAWFVFAASAAPAMIFVGLDAIILRAFPPVVWPGKPPKFITGSGAVRTGWAFILGSLLFATLWGFFAYAVGTFNIVMLEPLIRIFSSVVGIGMTVAILYSIFQKISRTR